MEDNDTIVFENSEISWSRPLRFWLLFISVIPSITCSLFVLYHLLFDQTLRHALNNHTIIVLLLLALVFQLIDVTWYLDFIRRGIVWPQTPARCLVWWLVDLVYTLPVCGATPCHILHPIIGLWEMGVHGCLCTMIIAFSSIALLIRVIIQKHRHNQIFQWKKYRKNDISTVVARQCGLPADVGVEELLVAFFITYWVMLLLPIVSLMFLPGLKTRITKLVDWQGQHQATVVPTIRNVNTVPGT